LDYYNLDMYIPYLNNIREALNLDEGPEEVTKGTCDSGRSELVKAGAFVAFFPSSQTRYYLVEFDNNTEYKVYWSTNPNNRRENLDPTTGNKGEDCVFTEALCFVLYHWWQGSFLQGDYFEFKANPNYAALEMPVLFYNLSGASAYTTNHVNSLVKGSSNVVTGAAHGPVVDYLGQGSSDILRDYAKKIFQKAGYSVTTADSRFYHHFCGDVHCGTNTKRVIPTYKWWDY